MWHTCLYIPSQCKHMTHLWKSFGAGSFSAESATGCELGFDRFLAVVPLGNFSPRFKSDRFNCASSFGHWVTSWSAVHIGHFCWVAAFATGCFPLPSFLSAYLVLLDPRLETGISPRPSSILLFSTSVFSTSSRVISGFASSRRCNSLASCWSWVNTCCKKEFHKCQALVSCFQHLGDVRTAETHCCK